MTRIKCSVCNNVIKNERKKERQRIIKLLEKEHKKVHDKDINICCHCYGFETCINTIKSLD